MFSEFRPLWLFCSQTWRNSFGGKRFDYINDIVAQINAYFEEIDKYYYLGGLKIWETLDEVWGTHKKLRWETVFFGGEPVFQLKRHGGVDPSL